MVLSIALAFVFGYALTMRGVLRAGVPFRQALRVALAADTVSIAVMEIIDNAVVVAVPGAMDAGLTSALFWLALAGSLAVAFVVTTAGQPLDDRPRQGARRRPRLPLSRRPSVALLRSGAGPVRRLVAVRYRRVRAARTPNQLSAANRQ